MKKKSSTLKERISSSDIFLVTSESVLLLDEYRDYFNSILKDDVADLEIRLEMANEEKKRKLLHGRFKVSVFMLNLFQCIRLEVQNCLCYRAVSGFQEEVVTHEV